MMARLIRWSIGNRFLVLLATLMIAAWGVYSVMRTPLDAVSRGKKECLRWGALSNNTCGKSRSRPY